MASNPDLPQTVTDEHFLGHVVESAHDVQASEDIVASNGMKLLAKGAKVDEGTRERLLRYKLTKPLEQCLVVADAITSERLTPLAQKLLDEQPLLRALCGSAKPQPVVAALTRLPLTTRLRSLLSLYAELPSDRLEHSVAVALLAHGLARKVLPDEQAQERILLTAGLFHDIGELYVNPNCFKGGALEPADWRHIAAHPVIGHRVLRDLDGAGALVADAVLHHHERRDGFGYPRGLTDDALPPRGEILAAAEWLAGMLRGGRSPASGASAAARLMPGGFSQSIVRAVMPGAAAQASEDGERAADHGDLLARFIRVCDSMGRYRRERAWIEKAIQAGTGASDVIAASHERMLRIERSLVSSGLSGEDPSRVFEQLNALGDHGLLVELGAIVSEIEWRLREVERDCALRAGWLAAREQEVVQGLLARLRHDASDAGPAQHAADAPR